MQWTASRDIPERVPATVTILAGVGHLADAHTVEHNQNDSLETHLAAPVGEADPKASWMRSVSTSTNESGLKPFIRLTTNPFLPNTTVVGIEETRRALARPSS